MREVDAPDESICAGLERCTANISEPRCRELCVHLGPRSLDGSVDVHAEAASGTDAHVSAKDR